jgi:uncharacterized protein YecT (DUF1311 family)
MKAEGRFGYKLEIDRSEGPLTPAVIQRYTPQWDACQQRAVTTDDHLSCLAAEVTRQDRKLNRVWKLAIKRLSPASRRQLIIAQRKWISARDPFCQKEANRFSGAMYMPLIFGDCQAELIIRRTMWLAKIGR